MCDKPVVDVVDQLLEKPIVMQIKSCHPKCIHLLIDACSERTKCYVQVRNCFHENCCMVSDDFARAIDELLWNTPEINGLVCNVLVGVAVLAVPTSAESKFLDKVASLVTRGYSIVLFNELVENT